MPAPHTLARSQLTTVLGRHGPASAADLADELGVSVPTLHRLLKEQGSAIVFAGKARRARYALRRVARGIEGDASDLPLYEVDADGGIGTVSRLTLVRPEGTCLPMAGTGWPVPPESQDGWWAGLPYPLDDMAPQGYMGRQLARAEHQALRLDPDPQRWSDDDVVLALSRIGDDMSGSLILGDTACERWMQRKAQPPDVTPRRAIPRTYTRLAELAVAAGVRGSSVGGDFPKFAALRDLPGATTPHVLVKFSGADASPAVRRWADLLVCEHLALSCVPLLPNAAAAASRIVVHAGRTFLETERFDRHGLHGRSRLVSLAMLDAALVGSGSGDWIKVTARLAAAEVGGSVKTPTAGVGFGGGKADPRGHVHAGPMSAWGGARSLIGSDDLDRIAHLHWFGRLIANTDMHLRNLSFRPNRTLELAPAYDMLPMLYAPLAGGEVPQRTFDLALPLPPQRAVWHRACEAALSFWQRGAEDSRISASFRAICAGNLRQLRLLADRV